MGEVYKVKLEQQTIYRGILTVQQGELTVEEQAILAVNIQRGHILKSVSANELGEIEMTFELTENRT